MSDFLSEVGDLEGGTFGQKVEDAVREVARAVSATGKPGEFTMKFRVSANGQHGYTVEPTVTAKVPKPKPSKSVFFRGPGDSLQREAPASATRDLFPLASVKE